MSWIIAGMQKEPPSPYLLDTFPTAAAAYSLRQLRTGNTNVVRVRRSSDNTESDFTATQVNNGSLAAWVGVGNNGFATIWYDQSGNSRHATQTTTANQPQIVSNGSLVLTNTKPALDFNGTSQRFIVPIIAFNMNALSANIVSKADASTSQMAFACIDPNRVYMPFLSSGVYYVGYAGASTAFNFGSSNLNSQYLVQLNAGSSTANAWRNGTGSTAVASSSAAEAGLYLTVGAYDARAGGQVLTTALWDGTIQEVVFYDFDQTTSQPAIASNINAHYAIY
jgi:hypothetical protein